MTRPRGRYDRCALDAPRLYPSSGFLDDLSLAAITLYFATGGNNAVLLNQAKAHFVEFRTKQGGWRSWDHDNAQHAAALLLHRADPAWVPAKDSLDHSFVQEWANGKYTPGVSSFSDGNILMLCYL